jgi:ribosome maturation factor RimP
MSSWRQFVAFALAAGMLHLTLVDVARSAEPTSLPNPATVKEQVNLFGVGAKVKVRLADGKKLNGTIEGIETSTFLVASKASSPTPVAYDQVARLKFTKETYKANGPVDAVEVRRVVAGLGVGRHIMVKTMAGDEYHGNILVIRAENFTMLADHETAPVQIAYDETLRTGPNLSKGAKIAIVVVMAIVIGVLVTAIAVRDD